MTKQEMLDELDYALGAIPSEEARQNFRTKFLNSRKEVQEDIIQFFLFESTQDLIYRKTQERLGI